MDKIINKKKELDAHLSTASMAVAINDYLEAYQNYMSAGDNCADLAELVLDKDEALEYQHLGKEYHDRAKKFLAQLHLPADAEGKLRPRKPAKGFEEFVGCDNIKDYLKDDVISAWKSNQFSSRKKNGIFMYGPEGCAKTTLVQSLIHELGATGYFIEPLKNFSIYNTANIESHLQFLFDKAEEKNNVVFYFDKPAAFFPKDYSKEAKKTNKLFMKLVLKEMKRVRKLNLNILFVAASSIPDKINPKVFGKKGIFDDLIRIHHPDRETREKMIAERLSDYVFIDGASVENLAILSHGYSSKELSRLCRSVKRQASYYEKEGEVKHITGEMIDKVMREFVPTEDSVFNVTVDEFEAHLPSNITICNR